MSRPDPKSKITFRFRDCAISSVAQMMRALKNQAKSSKIIWFRGQSQQKWKLIPSLARNITHLNAESAHIKRFQQNAAIHLRNLPQSEWEWMFLMQHHRASTRLLDWSESPLVALFFAVSEKKYRRSPGVVWCLDPLALNKFANLKEFPFPEEIPAFGIDKVMNSYLPSLVKENPAELLPVAIVGPRNTQRMAAQLGTFTINHRLHRPIEEIGNSKHIWQWTIPARDKKNLLLELKYLGISELTLFPELDRVAEESKELLK